MNMRVIGAGIAGCTAAYLLRKAGHSVTVYEATGHVGGLAFDGCGYQHFGPHVLHTDDKEVWDFLNGICEWHEVTLRVHAMQPTGLVELPMRGDPITDIYSAKAWGRHGAPACATARYATAAKDYKGGYVNERWQGVPMFGFWAMCEIMLEGCEVHYNTRCAPERGDIYTGLLDLLPHGLGILPWAGRTFCASDGELPQMVINYCTHDVPQIRSWDNFKINPMQSCVVGTEFYGASPTHPVDPDCDKAQAMREWAKANGITLLGRMASYRYMDIDHVVRQVMEAI